MRKSLDLLYLASGWIGACFIAAIAALVVLQVCLNLIDRVAGLLTGTAIGLTIPSYADFTGFFLAAASFLALAHTLRCGAHIRVNLVISHLPARIARLLEFWCVGVAAAIAVYFSFYTAGLVGESYEFHDLSPGMIAVPLWIPQTAMLIGLIILSIALIDELINLIRGGAPSYRRDDQLSADGGPASHAGRSGDRTRSAEEDAGE